MSYRYEGNGKFSTDEENRKSTTQSTAKATPPEKDSDIGGWLFIALMFAVAWPIGLILLISKLSDLRILALQSAADGVLHSVVIGLFILAFDELFKFSIQVKRGFGSLLHLGGRCALLRLDAVLDICQGIAFCALLLRHGGCLCYALSLCRATIPASACGSAALGKELEIEHRDHKIDFHIGFLSVRKWTSLIYVQAFGRYTVRCSSVTFWG